MFNSMLIYMTDYCKDEQNVQIKDPLTPPASDPIHMLCSLFN